MAGYSNTALVRKLGIKPGQTLFVRNAPVDYAGLLGGLPQGVRLLARCTGRPDLIHHFTRSRAELGRALAGYRERVAEDGTIWVSWPKKASGVASTVTEDVVRELALPLGLVDVKVCAVDETWSGLKLVIRKALRRQRR